MSDHGTRACYRAGCRRLECRAAEATYRRTLRTAHAKGRQPLGATVSAVETWRRIRQLKTEGLSARAIGRRLGHRRLKLGADVVTVRTAIKVRRLHRLLLSDEPGLNRRPL